MTGTEKSTKKLKSAVIEAYTQTGEDIGKFVYFEWKHMTWHCLKLSECLFIIS